MLDPVKSLRLKPVFVAAYAATPPNQQQRCILTDYFNNYNFSKLKYYAP
jgi:hypothetical protein